MSYVEELKTRYSGAHRRLMQDRPPIVIRPPKPMCYSGPATGRMWLGLDRDDHAFTLKGRDIIRAVLLVTGVSYADFVSHRRPRNFAETRWLACWFMRNYTGLSLPQIGALIGGRDHSTIMHGIERVRRNPQVYSKRIRAVADALMVALPEEVPFQ